MTAEVAKKAVTLGLLEEDDVFEEFPTKGKYFLTIFSSVRSTSSENADYCSSGGGDRFARFF